MFMHLSKLADAGVLPALAVMSTPSPYVHGLDDPRREEVESFIRDVFGRRYGAKVQHFAPTLVSLQSRGEIVAAAGYRSAADGPLFLECYLASPIEQALASRTQPRVERHGIVEVGHLAASRAGEGIRLISLIGPHLAKQGFVWVVGTLTRELHHLFLRVDIAPLTLGAADPSALGPDVVHWGTYYDHCPAVFAGNLQQVFAAATRRDLPED